MSEPRPLVRGLTPAVVVVIVALLATFVALAAIESSVAIVIAIFGFIFGDDLLRQFRRLLESREPDSATGAESATEPEDALERLRVRYADGELGDAEFERRLEVLLETETVADVERYLEDATPRSASGGPETDVELDRELERSRE